MELSLPQYDGQEAAQFIYTLADAYFAYLEQEGEAALEQLSDEQHTVMAYVYLDSQVQEGGFVQLIAAGYGEYVFMNPLADSLRRWRIKPTPKIIDQARALYEKNGAAIEALADEGAPLEAIRARFADFEELDGDYYDAADEDLAAAAEYVQANPAKFLA